MFSHLSQSQSISISPHKRYGFRTNCNKITLRFQLTHNQCLNIAFYNTPQQTSLPFRFTSKYLVTLLSPNSAIGLIKVYALDNPNATTLQTHTLVVKREANYDDY